MERGRPSFTQEFAVSRVTQESVAGHFRFRLQDFHSLWSTIPNCSATLHESRSTVLQPPDKSGFGLFPFRSSLTQGISVISFPPGTKIFQFPGCPVRFDRTLRYRYRRGFPIRTSPDQRFLTAPRRFSQPDASFFGTHCQGIHCLPM